MIVLFSRTRAPKILQGYVWRCIYFSWAGGLGTTGVWDIAYSQPAIQPATVLGVIDGMGKKTMLLPPILTDISPLSSVSPTI